MFSRHRAHLALVSDALTGRVLADADPGDPGVAAHRRLLDALAPDQGSGS